MTTRLGVVTALPFEARWLVQTHLVTGERAVVGSTTLVQVSGQGGQQAYQVAQSLLDSGATALLSWGSAGALDSNLASGTVILPNTVIGADERQWPVDARWHERLSDRLHSEVACRWGTLASSDEILTNVRDKQRLAQKSGAIGVDMESAGVARAAYQARVPYHVIRAIVDRMHWTLPPCVTQAVDAHGVIRPSVMLLALLKHPLECWHLVRLVSGWQTARASMRRVVATTGTEFMAEEF